ncbi:MAG: c-type cytochrome [Gammaproteobacteria bacterium]
MKKLVLMVGGLVMMAGVAMAADKVIPDGIDMEKGKKTYEAGCMVCHAAGVAGAPKLGDKAAWGPRIAQGFDTLKEHAIKGFKAMPPKGGLSNLADDDIVAGIAYMVSQAQ